MEKENSGRSFFIGFLVGGVVGSVLTIWLAPKARRQMRERGIDVGGRLGGLGALIKEKGDEFMARAREVIKQAVEEGKKASDEARSSESRFWVRRGVNPPFYFPPYLG